MTNRTIDLYRTRDNRRWTLIPDAPDRKPDFRAVSARPCEPDFALDRIYLTGCEDAFTPAQVALAARCNAFGLAADPTFPENGRIPAPRAEGTAAPAPAIPKRTRKKT